MSRIYTFADGETVREVTHLESVPLVSEATRRYERDETAGLSHGRRDTSPRSWVRLAKNRIAFRHDTRFHLNGAISATLPHAIY